MTYYEIILDNQIIGVTTSDSCLRYQAAHDFLESTTVELAEFIEYHNKLYRSTWMRQLPQANYNFIEASILEITEEEYNTLEELFRVEQEIPYVAPSDEEIYIPDDSINILNVETARRLKIQAMSQACNQTIEAGFDLALSDGEVHHFSLTAQDQLNLMNLSALAETEQLIPYHADNEACKFYTAEEIKQIASTATQFKMYHTTYYNALKGYINSLETLENISAVTYGVDLPQEFQTDVLKVLLN